MSMIEYFKSEDRACLYLESYMWPDKPECPSCGEHQRIGRLNGFTTTTGTWKCYACRKPFSARRNTLFEGSHIPVHVWLQGLYILAGTDFQIGAKRLATILGLSLRSAFLIKHKVQMLVSVPLAPGVFLNGHTTGYANGYSSQSVLSGTSALRFQRFILAISDFDLLKTEAIFQHIFPQLLVAHSTESTGNPKEYHEKETIPALTLA